MKHMKWYEYSHRRFVLISVVFFLSHILFLDSDFHVLALNEANNYLSINLDTQNLSLGLWLAKILGYLTFAWGKLISLRLLGLAGIWLSGFSIYKYVLARYDLFWANFLSILFFCFPVVFFLAHRGTVEPLMWGLGLISWVLLSQNPKNRKNIGIAAVLFSFAVLVDLQALWWIFGFALWLLGDLEARLARMIYFFKFSFFSLVTCFFALFIVTGGRVELMSSNSGFSLNSVKLISLIPNLLSWPGLVLLVFGFVSMMKWAIQNKQISGQYLVKIKQSLGLIKNSKFNKYLEIFTSSKNKEELKKMMEVDVLILPGILWYVFSGFDSTAFLGLIPGILIVIRFGLERVKLNHFGWVAVIAILPFTYQAFLSTQHMGIRSIEQVVREINESNIFAVVYSSFEPEILSKYWDMPIKKLSEKAFEEPNRAIVITSALDTDKGMMKIKEKISDKHLIWEYEEVYGHFPEITKNNEFRVYLVKMPGK